jgi:hypothetical protein
MPPIGKSRSKVTEKMPTGIRPVALRLRKKLKGLTDGKYENETVVLRLYHDLSEYVHTSTRTTLDRLSTEDFSPYLYYDKKRFEEIHALAFRTIDVVIWLLMHSMCFELRYPNCVPYLESLGRPIIETLADKRMRKVVEKLPCTYLHTMMVQNILNQAKRTRK